MPESTAPLQKMGEIKMPEVNTAQLARLDPSIPYIILLRDGTPDRVVTELVAFFGRCNVMATVLVGDPSKFRMFASTPWNVAPQQIRPDIHKLTLEPHSKIAEILRRNFVSAIHDDAEAVETLYQRLIASGLDSSNLTQVEAMVRCSIMRFQVLDELLEAIGLNRVEYVHDPKERHPKRLTGGGTRATTTVPPVVQNYQEPKIFTTLADFLPESFTKSGKLVNEDPDYAALASQISLRGVTDSVENEILRLQNANRLTSGVKTALKADFPEIKAEKAKRTTVKAPVKRTTRKTK